jgi:hypothetical protein
LPTGGISPGLLVARKEEEENASIDGKRVVSSSKGNKRVLKDRTINESKEATIDGKASTIKSKANRKGKEKEKVEYDKEDIVQPTKRVKKSESTSSKTSKMKPLPNSKNLQVEGTRRKPIRA